MIAAAKYIQQAIYTLLIGDLALMAILEGVFDYPPDNMAYPFIQIGAVTSTEYRTLSRPGEEVTVTIHIYSDYLGNKEALEILDEVNRLMGDVTNISISNYTLIASWFEFYEVLRDHLSAEGLILCHIPVRYRFKVQSTTGYS